MERILVVDDEIEVCTVLKEFLDSKGYETHIALTGRTALRKVKEVKPRIVLLDIIMPGMGGIEVLKEIKKIDPTLGVIMVTAVDDHELAMQILELGADDYITKPLDLDYIELVVMAKIIDLIG
jgi:DNA-binding response OmpR family regulator